MVTREMQGILADAREHGWVMEPQAKRFFGLAGLDVPRGGLARTPEEAGQIASVTGYPVVAKVVSPTVIHKSDIGGVVTGLVNREGLEETFSRLSKTEGFEGLLVEEQLEGIEVIVGAKIDRQFGPVILMGLGGTMAEIYGDVALRMAPITERDVSSMVGGLKGKVLFTGYRGSRPPDMAALTALVTTFSIIIEEIGDTIDSVDLNPVLCSWKRCTVADARIMLKKS